MKGVVKWFNLAKGFGVVTPVDDPETEVFCHVTNIENGRSYTGFNIGDEVDFELNNGRKGPYATHVNLGEQPESESENNE